MLNYYKILGVERGVSENEIKKAYKKMAVKHHPDKGGNEEEFKLVAEAYDTLSNKEKRNLYDMGMYNKCYNHHFVDPHEIFRKFFSGDSFPITSMMSSTSIIGNLKMTKETIMKNGIKQEIITETNLKTGDIKKRTTQTPVHISQQAQTLHMFFEK